MANSFTGTFSTPAKEAEFMGYTTNVPNNAFHDETGLTSISMPDVVTTGYSIFIQCPLKTVYLPKCTTLGANAFRDCNNIIYFYGPLIVHCGANALQGMKNHSYSKCFISDTYKNTTNRKYIFGTRNYSVIKFFFNSIFDGLAIGPEGDPLTQPFSVSGKDVMQIKSGTNNINLRYLLQYDKALWQYLGFTEAQANGNWIEWDDKPNESQTKHILIDGVDYTLGYHEMSGHKYTAIGGYTQNNSKDGYSIVFAEFTAPDYTSNLALSTDALWGATHDSHILEKTTFGDWGGGTDTIVKPKNT